jgi:hypothetical protein
MGPRAPEARRQHHAPDGFASPQSHDVFVEFLAGGRWAGENDVRQGLVPVFFAGTHENTFGLEADADPVPARE